MDLREKFKKDTGLLIDINTRVFAHSVTHINVEYVLWLEQQLKDILPDEDIIKARVDQHEQYHLVGMTKDYRDGVPVEFASMCCSNSFDDAIRWIKEHIKSKFE